jgi:hypothetical protein
LKAWMSVIFGNRLDTKGVKSTFDITHLLYSSPSKLETLFWMYKAISCATSLTSFSLTITFIGYKVKVIIFLETLTTFPQALHMWCLSTFSTRSASLWVGSGLTMPNLLLQPWLLSIRTMSRGWICTLHKCLQSTLNCILTPPRNHPISTLNICMHN